MTPLGPGYGVTDECMKCGPGCDNDMLLMSGSYATSASRITVGRYLPNVRRNVRKHNRGRGTGGKCDDGAYGDHCQFRVVSGSERWVPNFAAVMLALLVAIFIH